MGVEEEEAKAADAEEEEAEVSGTFGEDDSGLGLLSKSEPTGMIFFLRPLGVS